MADISFGTTLSTRPPADGSLRFVLAVIGDGAVYSASLPESGSVTIGRAEGNDVWLDDPLMSRHHAVLHVEGSRLELEDLGGANGSVIGGRRLPSRDSRSLPVGQSFELGSTMFVVQRRSTAERPRRLWPHEYFEMRVEEECSRPRRSAPGFTILWIHLANESSASAVEAALEQALLPSDVVSRWMDREYEVLLLGTQLSRQEQVRAAIREATASNAVSLGLAQHPRDGATADVLLARARESAHPSRADVGGAPVVEDRAMLDLYRLAEKVARGKISVLLLGETGVGKEVLAETIHARSPRARGPLVRFNCAAFTESLLEAELFGYEKGAFTGADREKAGLLESADGGTVFLDEVGELPAAVQAKLLRVLEKKEVQRVGALRPKTVDLRFVSATNRDLEREVLKGSFRQDLLFRLNGVTLTIPPLRERRAEIAHLAGRFVAEAAREAGLPVPSINAEALEWLEQYDWPGNLRELRNVVERAVLLAGGGPITLEELPIEKSGRRFLAAAPVVESEGERIRRALDACAGNQSRAAKLLGVSRRTLLRKLDEHELPRPRKESGSPE